MSGTDIRHPVAHRFIDGFLERLLSGGHGNHRCPEEPHPRHVQRLPLHVDRAHVDDAFEAEPRRDGGRGHAVLARAGFGNDPLFAHSPCQ